MSDNIPLDSNYCAIAFLADVSGSMSSFDTKEFAQSVTDIIKENSEQFEVVFYGATFSDKFEIFADGVNGSTVEITEKDLQPSGLTAIVPALGRMIRHVGTRLADMTERRPGKVIFITLTDGEQTVQQLRNRIPEDATFEGINAYPELRKLIDEHQNVWKWSFMFMGTNIDSINTGASLGFSRKQCINFATTDYGIKNVMRCASNNISKVQRKAKFRIDTVNASNGSVVINEDDDDGFDDSQRIKSMMN